MLQVEELVKQSKEAFSQVALVVYRLLFLFAVHSVSVKQPAIEERLTYLTHASTQPHYHHYRHDNFFVIFIHFILKCMIKQNFIEHNVLWLFFQLFIIGHHIYTCQPTMPPLFWCLDTGRLRVSDVSSFRSRHVACTGCPRNGDFSSNLILLISNSVFLYPYKPACYGLQSV